MGKKNKKNISDEISRKVSGYILAALGLVAGLAWNDAISSLIESLFPLEKNTIAAKFFYAVIITAIVVITSIYLIKFFNKKSKK